MTQEALKMALEALKDVGVLTDREWQAVHKNKANELRQAIAELESQEPVAWRWQRLGQEWILEGSLKQTPIDAVIVEPLYTHPPQRTWVGLTDEEAQQTFARHNCTISTHLAGILTRAIEAKLKEKNSA